MIINLLRKTAVFIFALTAVICSVVFISSCGKEETLAHKIINAEKKSLESEEYIISSSFSMAFSVNGFTERINASADWGEIIEKGNKIEYFHITNGDKIYRTCGFDFKYSNYGNLSNVKKSEDSQLFPAVEADTIEDFDGAEIILESEDIEYYIYNVKVGEKQILKQLGNMQLDKEDLEEFDFSDIKFPDEINLKYCITKDGYLYSTKVDDLKISIDINGVEFDATMSLALYINTDREEVNKSEVDKCMSYVSYYTDEDKILRGIENHNNPQKAQIVSEEGHVTGYKIAKYGKDSGIVSGDSKTGKIAAASCDELQLFSYVDIYDKDMLNIQTLYFRGEVKTVQINKNYFSINLKENFFDKSYCVKSLVIDLNDGKIIAENEFDVDNWYCSAILFGNSFVYGDSFFEFDEETGLTVYNIENDVSITPEFNCKPINGSIEVNANGNLLVYAIWDNESYILEINDMGEVVASLKRTINTFGDRFIGKYWVGADWDESDKKIYYNAEEETEYINIGDYTGNGKAQFIYIDDSYAVILDSAGSGYFVYDFKNSKYVLENADKGLGIIDCHYYLGDKRWLITINYDECIFVFGV